MVVSDVVTALTGHEEDHKEEVYLNRICLKMCGRLLRVNEDLVMKTFVGFFENYLVNCR